MGEEHARPVDFTGPAENTSFIIRSAEADEIPIVHRIMRQAFEQFRDRIIPPSGALLEEIADIEAKFKRGGGALLAWLGGEAVGSVQIDFAADYMYIGRLSVVDSARGLGLGTALMEAAERIAVGRGYVETRIGVRLSVPKNVPFYLGMGYEVLEHREYPARTDSWYVMRKRLEGAER
ncbi:GNAT family N-acetyltransferase [Paenibacillus rhizovicinus]|uniref:GNAT family N-acetyltransferase n=1 Tax=Paenibacillus rhizovicinus TaxID=2704463 RepID=A0A6C0P4P9_9BACL|nr:GNAT family N-acetyltransferase [Paenibacillus rhizovicinus]QHW33427.1 GNAT family N-acetyltransferase [Paenibacillus rhizovicinus]